MTTHVKLKEAFDVEQKYGAFYTGGNVEWHGGHLYCQTASCVALLNVEDGNVSRRIGGEGSDEDLDEMQTFTSDGLETVTAHKSGLLKLWNERGELVKAWKCIHRGPLAALRLKRGVLASGGSDGVVRVWETRHQACVSSLRGAPGVVALVEFVPFADALMASGDDGKILAWQLPKGETLCVYSAHFSKATALQFHHDGRHFVSCGRDKVIILWEYGKAASLRMIPLSEAVESVLCLPEKFKLPGFKPAEGGVYVASGGESGRVRVWDVSNAKLVYAQADSLVSKAKEEGCLSIARMVFDAARKSVALVTVGHEILLYALKSFLCLKQFVGFSDEILDVSYVGRRDSHIAVATNSPDIKLYESVTMNCQLLKGHRDIVLALDKAKTDRNLLASSSKDNTIRLWRLMGDATMLCVGVGVRHTDSVTSVAFSRASPDFMVSVGQDACIKLWDVPKSPGGEAPSLTCTRTEIAHQKEINCVSVSPNDKIIATSSQDKTVKLWTDSLSLVGVLRGHKRGVWSADFSPVDQVLATSSADCTVKLWSVVELNCLKTFEGHESSVLRVNFVTNGMQLLSCGADGLLKLFNLKSSECAATLDQHEGRIWALDLNEDETGFVTGGSDSQLIKWKDVSEQKRKEQAEQLEELALQEQNLSNYVRNGEMLKALKVALRLDKPLRVLRIVERVLKEDSGGLFDTVSALSNEEKDSLLKCAVAWNTNGRNCQAAQLILNILIALMEGESFTPAALGGALEGAIPYTERHFKRLTQLLQDLHFIAYTVNCMRPCGADAERR